MLTPPSEAVELAGALSAGRLARIPEAGHMTPLEAPEAVKEELFLFLAGLDTDGQS